MNQNRRPVPFNVVPGDTEGTTWALPEGAIARLGKGRSPNIALSSKNHYFAVGTMIGLWWYDMSSKSPIAFWETERGMISEVEFSPNGNWIAIANWDGVIKVLDAQSGECLGQMKRMQKQNLYYYLDFSPDCRWIATASWNGYVEVLDVHQGICVAQMDRGEREVESADITHLTFSPNGQFVAATAYNLGSEGTLTYIWHSETGELIFKINSDKFLFSPDCQLLAAATPIESSDDSRNEESLSVWNFVTGERVSYIKGIDEWVDTITFSPCSEFIAFTDSYENLSIWNFGKGKKKHVNTDFQTKQSLPFYTPQGDLFTFGNGEDIIEVWNIESSEKLSIPDIYTNSIDAMWCRKYPQLALTELTQSNKSKLGKHIHDKTAFHRFDNVPNPVEFLPDGKTLASTSERTGIVLWDVEKWQVQDKFLSNIGISSFLILPSGNIVGDCSYDNTVYVWSSEQSDKPIAEFSESEHTELGRGRAFAPTGNKFAIGSRKGTIYLYDFNKKEKLGTFIGHTDFVWAVAFSPNGKRLASGSVDRTPRLWDVETGEEIAKLPLDKPKILMGIAFSPCGRVIAGGMYGELRLWSNESLTTLFTIPQLQSEKPYALAFSPCGRYLASGTWWQKGMEKMAIRLWEVASGKSIATLWGHPTDIQSLAFSPDGNLLASGSFDGTIMLWDMTPYP